MRRNEHTWVRCLLLRRPGSAGCTGSADRVVALKVACIASHFLLAILLLLALARILLSHLGTARVQKRVNAVRSLSNEPGSVSPVRTPISCPVGEPSALPSGQPRDWQLRLQGDWGNHDVRCVDSIQSKDTLS